MVLLYNNGPFEGHFRYSTLPEFSSFTLYFNNYCSYCTRDAIFISCREGRNVQGNSYHRRNMIVSHSLLSSFRLWIQMARDCSQVHCGLMPKRECLYPLLNSSQPISSLLHVQDQMLPANMNRVNHRF